MKKKLMIVGMCFVTLLVTGCGSSDITYEIESDMRNADYAYGYGTTYAVGKTKSAICEVSENDGNGRYLLECTIKYSPKLNNGMTDLSQETTEKVLAVYMSTSSNKYVRRYAKETQRASLKSGFCWGKSSATGYSCN